MTNKGDARPEETRRRLVEAGLELFGRQGFDAVTTRQLAEAAGVNQAAIPYHFGGKEGVYRAVAEQVAAEVGVHVRPLVASVRERLAMDGSRQAVASLLLETTLAVGRVALEQRHVSMWITFLAREPFLPSAAFECLHAEFARPVHMLAADLLGRLLGQPPEAADTILLTHAYLGQILAFVAARLTLDRRLGRIGDHGQDDVAAILAAIEKLSRYAIAGMAANGG